MLSEIRNEQSLLEWRQERVEFLGVSILLKGLLLRLWLTAKRMKHLDIELDSILSDEVLR